VPEAEFAALAPVEGAEEEPAVDPFVDPEFVEPLFVEPAFGEPVFAEFEPDAEPALNAPVFAAPALGVEEFPAEPVAPGMAPQGEVVEDDPGVFGLIVDGLVVLPGVGGLGDVAPGIVAGLVGVAVLPGGVAVLSEGVAAPDVFPPVLPALPAFPAPAAGAVPPAGAAPPAGALCATTQTAQAKNIVRTVSFVADIGKPPCSEFVLIPTLLPTLDESRNPYSFSVSPHRSCTYRADALDRLQQYGTE
jgi:hypothetical protein